MFKLLAFPLGNFTRALTILGFLFFAFGIETAEALTGEEVMRQAYEQARIHKNQSSEVRLTIVDKRNAQRIRYFRSFYKIFRDRTKSLAKFYKPSSIRGTGLLSETKDGSARTEQWLYLPALRTVRKLNTRDKHKSFMGSDFTNADIAGRKVEQDRHKILEENEKLWIVESIPKDGSDPYGRILSHILKSVDIPSRVIFYDRKGRKIKTLRNEKIARRKGMYYVQRGRMKNHLSEGESLIERSRMNVARAIDPRDVGFKGLSR